MPTIATTLPRVLSVRENPASASLAIAAIQSRWPAVRPVLYHDCITHCIGAPAALPQWYLLCQGDDIIGCAGLVTNDFISRMDLYPWICALFVDEAHRGRGYGGLLLAAARNDAAAHGFRNVYLATDHRGYYEKHGFHYIGQGYHPWGDKSRIYEAPAALP